MLRTTVIAATTWLLVSAAAHAQGVFNDSHSLESIRAALSTPVPIQILSQARQVDEQILRTGQVSGQAVRVVADHRTQRVANILTRVIAANSMDPSRWTVRVLDTREPSVNAFVFGGYFVYVFTGLVDSAQSDDELAMILGHEIGHSLLNQVHRKSEDLTQLVAQLAQLSAAFSKNAERKEKRGLFAGALRASYQREDELEADAFGAWVAHRAGYDPGRGADFFRRQSRQEAQAQQRLGVELAVMKGRAEQRIADCNNLKARLASNPLLQSARVKGRRLFPSRGRSNFPTRVG